MTKKMLAALIVALFVAPAAVSATPKTIAVDGCAKLARIVYSEVSAAVRYGPRRSGPWTIDTGRGDLVVCEHVAETVSRAFASAVGTAGIDVSWGVDEDVDYCPGGFLSRCHPNRDRRGSSMAGARTSFVDGSWSAVTRVVMRSMYNPFSSDEVRFRVNDLKLSLGLALRPVDRFDDG